MNENLETWQCQSCGEINSSQNIFCKKCGYNPNTPNVSNVKSGSSRLWKIIIISVIVLVLAGGGFAGFKFWEKKSKEKTAKTYIQEGQRIFGDSVKEINNISSETNLIKKYSDEKNKDLILEKMLDEKTKAEKLADAITAAKNNKAAIKSNEMTEGLNYLMDDYFSTGENLSQKYKRYMIFAYDDAKVNSEIEKKSEQFTNKFKKSPSNDSELIGLYASMKEFVDFTVSQYENLSVPEGLEEYKKPTEYNKELSAKIPEIISSIEKKDYKKTLELLDEMEAIDENFGKAIVKANELVEHYYSQMHDEFSSLRGKADKIKTELSVSSVKFDIQPLDFSVEGW